MEAVVVVVVAVVVVLVVVLVDGGKGCRGGGWRTKEAQEVYERALFYDSTNPDIYYNLGVVLLEQGRAQQALAYLDKALEMDPDHQQALLNSAVLIQASNSTLSHPLTHTPFLPFPHASPSPIHLESGNAELRPLAYQRLLRLVQRDPLNERIYFNLGMIAMDDRDYRNAEKWFRKAIELKEDFRSALFNLALLLTDDQRPLEAAPFLNQLVKHHPDHVKGLILLGDIYINNIKDLDAAEKCYERILAVDPGNVQGLHNLCVVYVERGELQAAETCLSRAHIMAPHEDYILRHLKIVRTRLAKLSQMQQQQQQQQQQGGGGSDRTPASVLPDGGDVYKYGVGRPGVSDWRRVHSLMHSTQSGPSVVQQTWTLFLLFLLPVRGWCLPPA
ncbi:Transmembrane and TPR repeat-containing protein [Chionoecetes opilio]|uniref:Transmembrane and TPR repeat-containing protein n=1 Tax=Chionoecetes opilio TaxID=41210 RepID=A0A8J8WF49_CHIOP|nr:Transmembrane and TPR repeat-containing protein [Chionoecetes opilio]